MSAWINSRLDIHKLESVNTKQYKLSNRNVERKKKINRVLLTIGTISTNLIYGIQAPKKAF